MKNVFHFQSEKAIEAICYIAEKAPIKDVYHVCKIQYYADLQHFLDYGRSICGDRYIAMRNGPVPSGTYDLIKDVRDDRPTPAKDHAAATFSVQGHLVKALRKTSEDILSESDIECLDEAIKKVGSMEFGELNRVSHDEIWESADRNDEIQIDVIANHLDPTGSLWEHLRAG